MCRGRAMCSGRLGGLRQCVGAGLNKQIISQLISARTTSQEHNRSVTEQTKAVDWRSKNFTRTQQLSLPYPTGTQKNRL